MTANQLHSIRIFVEVVERGSFSHAAHALHFGVSTVSEHVSSLERHLGVRLLNRTSRKMAATHEGERYYREGKRILQALEELDQSLALGDGVAPHGVLRIEICDGGVHTVVNPLLIEFQRRFPDVTLHVTQTAHMFDVIQSGADVMIRSRLQHASGGAVTVVPLGYSSTVCLAAPAYIERHGAPDTPEALFEHSCIGFIDQLTGRVWEWPFQRNGISSSIELPHRIAFSRGETRRELALAGVGIINDVRYAVDHLIADGRLVPVLEEWSRRSTAACIVYPKSRIVSGKVEALVRFLCSRLPPDGEFGACHTRGTSVAV